MALVLGGAALIVVARGAGWGTGKLLTGGLGSGQAAAVPVLQSPVSSVGIVSTAANDLRPAPVGGSLVSNDVPRVRIVGTAYWDGRMRYVLSDGRVYWAGNGLERATLKGIKAEGVIYEW